jgi:hypothetical protein
MEPKRLEYLTFFALHKIYNESTNIPELGASAGWQTAPATKPHLTNIYF